MTAVAPIVVTDASQIGEARRAATRLARACALDETLTGSVAIVATELATNLVRYARDGRVYLRAVTRAGLTAIEVLSIDAGPGMSDVQRCLQDGYSTGGTSGTGLGAVRRIAAEFDIHSAAGAGTVVVARVGPAWPGARLSWAALSSTAPGEDRCGDDWAVSDDDERLAVVVADGLGHGPLAAEAAAAVCDAFRAAPFDAPARICERAHIRARATRGAAMAAAAIDNATLRFAGVGNIAGTLFRGGDTRGLTSQNGTVGVQVRRIQEFEYPWGPGAVMVLQSDGLISRWSFDAYAGLSGRHPAVIAGVLLRDCLRGRDDATVVVVRDTTSTGRAS